MNRRLFLFASGGLSLSPWFRRVRLETEAAKDVTRMLARYVVSAKPADLPASGSKGSGAHAAELGRMHRRRLAARNRRHRDFRTGAIFRDRRRPASWGEESGSIFCMPR